MATANHESIQSSMSSEAYELLDCFSSEIGRVIQNIAEEQAKQRDSKGPGEGTLIEAKDIKIAVGLTIQAMKHLVDQGQIPSEAVSHLSEMADGFESSMEKE